MMNAACGALHRSLRSMLAHRLAAAAAETMLVGPSADLCSETEHAKPIDILVLHHELAQPLPGGARHLSLMGKLEQKHRLTLEIAEALLADQWQVQAFEPVSGKQHAAIIKQKTLLAMHECPAVFTRWVEPCRLPAQTHSGGYRHTQRAHAFGGKVQNTDARIVTPQDRATFEVVLKAGQGIGKGFE